MSHHTAPIGSHPIAEGAVQNKPQKGTWSKRESLIVWAAETSRTLHLNSLPHKVTVTAAIFYVRFYKYVILNQENSRNFSKATSA